MEQGFKHRGAKEEEDIQYPLARHENVVLVCYVMEKIAPEKNGFLKYF